MLKAQVSALSDVALSCCRYARLKFGRFQHTLNHVIVATLSFLRLAPKGTKEVRTDTAKVT